jgi:hypothetical protein
MGRLIGWGPRLMKRMSLFQICIPSLMWTCQIKKKKKNHFVQLFQYKVFLLNFITLIFLPLKYRKINLFIKKLYLKLYYPYHFPFVLFEY